MSEVNSIKANNLNETISHQYQAFQQLPAKTKTITAIISALILALILIVLISSSDDTSNTPPLSSDKRSPGNKNTKHKQAGIPLKNGTMHDIETTTKSLINQGGIEKFNAIKKTSEKNTEQIASVSNQLKELQAQLNPIPEEYQQQGVEIQNIHNQLSVLKTAQQKLQAALSKKVKRLRRKRRVTSRPSFELVSIDLWGNDASIIIRHKALLHDLSIGQSLGKWKVESIDIKSSRVIFSNQRGIKYTLFIES
jgi:hypothetical protein